MFRLNNKTRKYQTPSVKVTQMALESNFCTTGTVADVYVDEIHHVNADEDTQEMVYFDEF